MIIKFTNKKLITENINSIMQVVDEKVKNEGIYNYINENINCMPSKKMNIKVNENGLTIKNKRNSDSFEIIIIPNTIFTKFTSWNRLYNDVKQLDYLDNVITLKESSLKTIMDIENNSISSIDNKVNNMVYINNNLIYSEENEASTYFNIYTELFYSRIFKSTYILDNNKAIQNIIRIKDDNYDAKINYFKTNIYDERNFNTREIPQNVYVTDFEAITYDEYLSLLKNFSYNDQVTKVKEKKFIK